MRHNIRPSKTESKFGFFIGILFCLFGLGFLGFIIVSPISFLMLPFAILFTAGSFFNTYKCYKNGFTNEGYSMYEIDSPDQVGQGAGDFEEKLRKIERLRQDGLITEEEWGKKRSEIIDSNW